MPFDVCMNDIMFGMCEVIMAYVATYIVNSFAA